MDKEQQKVWDALMTEVQLDAHRNAYYKVNGKYHRLNGPAVEYTNGTKLWYKNGELHREDGPAIDYANGIKYWYIDGVSYTEEDFNKAISSGKN